MPPMHILPLRSVGVPLVIKVIETIFIKQSIGIVHPSVCGRMMIDRPPFLAIDRVENVRKADVAPADMVFPTAILVHIASCLHVY